MCYSCNLGKNASLLGTLAESFHNSDANLVLETKLASRPKFWPRPRPWPRNLGLGLASAWHGHRGMVKMRAETKKQ